MPLTRALIFNLAFYGLTTLMVVLFLPALILPEARYKKVMAFYFHVITWLEKYILGLTYTVEGQENLPADGRYIIGMKHYSAYETMKLHALFKDPAVILKRELLLIPIWGWHAAKYNMIPIDRSAKSKAIPLMTEHAKTLITASPHRPIVIFPQGTRVHPADTVTDKPYKAGIARLSEALDLPIIPVAVNSGVFWGRKAFIKKGGTVTFRFLPPIEQGLSTEDTLKQLAERIEPESNALVEQAYREIANRKTRPFAAIVTLLIALFTLWSVLWFQTADKVEEHIQHWTEAAQDRGIVVRYDTLKITGYPLQLQAHIDGLRLNSLAGNATIPHVHAKAWPIPGATLHIDTPQGIQDTSIPATIERISLSIKGLIRAPWRAVEHVTLMPLFINATPLIINSTGTLTLNQQGLYNGTLTHEIEGGLRFLASLMDRGLVNRTIGLLIENWVRNNAEKNTQSGENETMTIDTPVTDGKLYFGPFKLLEIPAR